MVRIVSTEPHHSVVKEVVCNNCGCTLAYVPADVETFTSMDYIGDTETIKRIRCPSCTNNVRVK